MVGDGACGQPDWPHIGVALMKLRARRRITVLSADPAVPPRIEHHYDSEPADVADLARGTEVARELAAAATQLGNPVVDIAAPVRKCADGAGRGQRSRLDRAAGSGGWRGCG